MIGSFWNLCRACPSMPIDKLHSEYRSTYTWHEYTGNQDQHTVVRRAPQAPLTKENAATKLQSAKPTEDDNTEGPSLEPPLPRRKKCPELAYRSHEFITSRAVDGGGIDVIDSNVVADKVREVAKVLPASQLSKAISRISTEYRLQFAWPRRQAALTNGEVKTDATADPTSRKSINMGGLRQGSIMAMPAPVHKKRPTVDHRRTGRDASQPSELEPLVTTVTTTTTTTRTTNGPIHEDHDEVDSTAVIKATTRERTVRIIEQPQPLQENKFRKGQERPFSASEVMELRRELKRLADEYKHRDWGGGISSEDEATLWKRVSNNHALNALSLARSATKEEKEKENTRKVAPEALPTTTNIAAAGRPSSVQARLLADADMKPDNDKAIRRARKDLLIRHHLDRTTGVGDGALLPSPTREKLEPVMPRRREEQSEIQPRSKSSPKNSPRSARSQSVGPAVAERRSPKRHPQRPPSAAKEKDKDKPDGREKSSERERHPRPSSVSRWKTRDASSKARSRSESTNRVRKRPVTPSIKPFLATNAPPHRPAHHAKPFNANTNVSNHASSQINAKIRSDTAATAPQPNAPTAAVRPSSMSAGSSSSQRAQRTASKAPSVPLRHSQAGQAMSAEQPRVNGHLPHPPGSAVAVTSPAQQQPRAWIDDEPVVKSPPEPTRVKSPEQMIMRSPEPVNWTVPLDTGKTFTVTQNVREGEPPARAHSETRSWTTGGPGSTTPDLAGGNKLPEHKPPAQPTQLHHLHHQSQPHGQQQLSGYKSPESESVSLGSFCGTNGHKEQEEFSLGERDSPVATISKDELAQQARCLEDPVFEYESKAKLDDGVSGTTSSASATVPPPGEQLASADLMEKARNRFDKFWGKGPEQ